MLEEWPNQNKARQNVFIDSLWREHRKTVDCPTTAHEAMQMSCDASLMEDWFYANRQGLDALTYARGLRLARMDERGYRADARYLTKKELEQ